MAYATTGDVEDRLGRLLSDSEEMVVTARLNDVETMILSKIPDLFARVTSGKLSADVVVLVECEVVIRYLRNPEGKTAETDGNYSYQLNWATATGRLMITPEEWSMLGRSRGVFTIAPRLYSQADVDYWTDNPSLAPWWFTA